MNYLGSTTMQPRMHIHLHHDKIYHIQQKNEPQMKVPRDSSTGTWTINMKKEPHVRLNNIQQLKFNRAPSITPVPKFQHRPNFVIACNTKVQLVKFYHKTAFSPSI